MSGSPTGRVRRERQPTDGERWLEAQSQQPPPSLRPLEIARAGLRAGRRHLGRVVAITAVVFGLLGAAGALAESLIYPQGPWFRFPAEVALASISVLGVTFLGGVFGRAVGVSERGFPEQTIWQILRTMPYGRMLVTDFLVTTYTAIGILLLVVPGFVVFTRLSLTGAAIRLERKAGFAALRRSSTVVRHHFWTVFVLATVPFTLGAAVVDIVDFLSSAPFVVYFLVRLVAVGIPAAVSGLMQSELGFRLMALARIEEAAAQKVS